MALDIVLANGELRSPLKPPAPFPLAPLENKPEVEEETEILLLGEGVVILSLEKLLFV